MFSLSPCCVQGTVPVVTEFRYIVTLKDPQGSYNLIKEKIHDNMKEELSIEGNPFQELTLWNT